MILFTRCPECGAVTLVSHLDIRDDWAVCSECNKVFDTADADGYFTTPEAVKKWEQYQEGNRV